MAARLRATGLPLGLALSFALTGCRPRPGWRAPPASDASTDAPTDASSDARAAPPEGGSTAAGSPEAGEPADDEMPPATSDELTERTRHLLEAMGKDESDLATDILFPRDGWLATRDADNPGKDWEKKVDGPFRKALHRLSRREKGVERAQFVAIELGHSLSQVTPKRHGWKKPLWVLSGARVTFVVDGRTRTLSIREMTAWRGAWYVTRLK
jgi:hypothetical protein